MAKTKKVKGKPEVMKQTQTSNNKAVVSAITAIRKAAGRRLVGK